MLLRSESVEQVVDGDVRATLAKEVHMIEAEHPLAMVRKHLPGGATRGPVLLVHGFGQNRYTWHNARRSFSAYLATHGWDVFNVDLRGHGRSRRFGAPRPRGLDDYIRYDVPAFAREALALSGRPRLFFVGHSMGGLLSYSVAGSELRDRTAGVVSIGSPYKFGRGSATLLALRALAAAVHFTGAFDENPVFPMRALGKHLRKRATLWDQRFPAPIRPWRPGSVEREVLDDYLERAFDRTSFTVGVDILRAGQEGRFVSKDKRVDYTTAFEMLEAPLLVIAGTDDMLAPPASVRPAYERSRSTDRTYREYPLGHVDLIIGREAPVTVWPLVQQWLARRG